MAEQPLPYDSEFYTRHREASVKAARLITPVIARLLPVTSVLDVGCGVGTWLRAWSELGVRDFLGVDGDHVDRGALEIPVERFSPAALDDVPAFERVVGDRRFDLVTCLEVAEHLPAAKADAFVRALTSFGDYVLFGAAIPGQGGTGHVNEQRLSYWCAAFRRCGFKPMDLVRPFVFNAAPCAFWYRQNTVLFCREGAPFDDVFERALESGVVKRAISWPLDAVHPDVFEERIGLRPSAAAATPAPLLLRSFGRTGTTVVMQLLGTSPNVLFDRVYPFEHRLLAYAARLGSLAGLPAQNDPAWNADSLFGRSPTRVGPVPYDEPSLDRGRFGRDAARGAIRAMLGALEASGAIAGQPLYYAEKIPLDLPPLINALVPETKNILLLRDPRDEYLSIRAFNEKRGTAQFGWRADDTDASFAERLAHGRKAFLRDFAATKPGPRTFTLRYEDLMRDGPGTAEALGAWLGVELSWEAVVSTADDYRHHVTSPAPESSVERWKRELPPEMVELFQRHLGEELSAVGYEA